MTIPVVTTVSLVRLVDSMVLGTQIQMRVADWFVKGVVNSIAREDGSGKNFLVKLAGDDNEYFVRIS